MIIRDDGQPEMSVPMANVLEMIFGDGNKWEWKLKSPLVLLSPSESHSVSSPEDDWMSLLEDESWFNGSFLLPSETSSEGGWPSTPEMS